MENNTNYEMQLMKFNEKSLELEERMVEAMTTLANNSTIMMRTIMAFVLSKDATGVLDDEDVVREVIAAAQVAKIVSSEEAKTLYLKCLINKKMKEDEGD